MRSNSTNDRRSAKQDKKQETAEVIAALTRINELSEPDRATTTQQAANMLVEQRELIAQLIAKVRWLYPARPSIAAAAAPAVPAPTTQTSA